ncbi:MAG: dipeptidase [Chlorobi bacterium]|nr:dipeptidase [Chlorobiota bacterium]
MKKIFSLTLIFALLFVFNKDAKSCTNFLITKGASADGSTMISYAADSHVLYGELYFFPAMDWADGTMLDIYEWDTGKFLGKIPQVSHTYNVVGNMNEFQLAIGETTYGGLESLWHQDGAIMDYGSLIYIALQRSKTAREAIKVIADLMDKYGYYSEGESFSIADPNEAWIMEIIGKGQGEKGAVWVARKIPDGYISGHANQARITTFPLDDPENCIYAQDVISFAKRKGLYKGKDADFSFSDVYAPVDFGGARFCEIRVWSMFKEVNNDMMKYFNYVKGNVTHKKEHKKNKPITKENYANNRMPLWIKPDKKISVHDMMNFMRDHLEGTELDMRKDIGAGPFELPYRWRPLTWKAQDENGETHTYCNERATSTQQTGFSFIAQARSWLPNEIGGIIWFSVDDAANSVYTPIYTSSTKVPEAYAVGNGKMMEWSDDAAFWVFNQVSNFAYTRYNLIHPEIAEIQQDLEDNFIKKVKAIDAGAEQLYKTDKDLAIEFITDFSVNNANALVENWKKLYRYLFMKYMDGNVKTPNPGHQNPHLKQPGYGQDFYNKIVKETKDKFLMPDGAH